MKVLRVKFVGSTNPDFQKSYPKVYPFRAQQSTFICYLTLRYQNLAIGHYMIFQKTIHIIVYISTCNLPSDQH